MMKAAQLILAALLAALLLALPAQAAPQAVPGELIVRYAAGTGPAERSDLRSDLGLRRKAGLGFLPRAERVRVPARGLAGLERLAAEVESHRDVAWAEPNYIMSGDLAPQDEVYTAAAGWHWGLRNPGTFVTGATGTTAASVPGADIDAALAWDLTTGSPSVIVGVVDSGLYADHPDLDDQTLGGFDFVVGVPDNPPGPPDTGIYEDDGTPGPDSNPDDRQGHGTHVTGTIVAEANNLSDTNLNDTLFPGSGGLVGVAWNVRLLPARGLGVSADGNRAPGTTASVANAYDYAGDNGASVVNASLSGEGISLTQLQVIEDHPDTLFVVAAGNDGTDNDSEPRSPCNLPAENIVCVGASNPRDQRAQFGAGASNVGATTVDVVAPGDDVWSTQGDPDLRGPANRISLKSGTSMATPHVAGIAALIKSLEPQATPARIKQCLIAGSEPIPALNNLSVSDGRVNARLALNLCTDHVPPTAPQPVGGPAAATRSRRPLFTWSDSVDERSGLGHYELVVDGAVVRSLTPGVLSASAPALFADGPHVVRTDALDVAGNRAIGGEQRFTVDNRRPRLKLKALRGPGVRLRVRANERVRLSARLKAKGRSGKAKLRGKLKAGTRGKLRVGVPRRLRRRLSPGDRVTVIVTAKDLAGNATKKRVRTRF